MSTKDIIVGAGTRVERESAVVTLITEDSLYPYPWVRITQTIHLSVEVPIGHDGYACWMCGKVPPLPDAAGGEFILENNDGKRICFPREESVRPERDCYPMTGWRKIGELSDTEPVQVCLECASDLVKIMAERRVALRKQSLDANARDADEPGTKSV